MRLWAIIFCCVQQRGAQCSAADTAAGSRQLCRNSAAEYASMRFRIPCRESANKAAYKRLPACSVQLDHNQLDHLQPFSCLPTLSHTSDSSTPIHKHQQCQVLTRATLKLSTSILPRPTRLSCSLRLQRLKEATSTQLIPHPRPGYIT